VPLSFVTALFDDFAARLIARTRSPAAAGIGLPQPSNECGECRRKRVMLNNFHPSAGITIGFLHQPIQLTRQVDCFAKVLAQAEDVSCRRRRAFLGNSRAHRR